MNAIRRVIQFDTPTRHILLAMDILHYVIYIFILWPFHRIQKLFSKHEMHQTSLADLAQVKQFLDTVKWP
jgi:hypothetical protein